MSLSHAPIPNGAATDRRRTVADVMTTGVVTAHLDAPAKEIAAAMARNRISAVPVISATREVVGVVTASDLLVHFSRRHSWSTKRRRFTLLRGAPARAVAITAQSLMSWPPIVVHPHTPIREAARQVASRRLHFMPVVDADGVLVGCVTGSDLNKIYLRSDEAITAEIEKHVVRELELIDPGSLGIYVDEGVAAITGTLESREQAMQLVEAVEAVPGVMDVRTRFSFREDRPSA